MFNRYNQITTEAMFAPPVIVIKLFVWIVRLSQNMTQNRVRLCPSYCILFPTWAHGDESKIIDSRCFSMKFKSEL